MSITADKKEHALILLEQYLNQPLEPDETDKSGSITLVIGKKKWWRCEIIINRIPDAWSGPYGRQINISGTGKDPLEAFVEASSQRMKEIK